jgi:hypothetical protein
MNCLTTNPKSSKEFLIFPHKLTGGNQAGNHFAFIYKLPNMILLHRTEIHSSKKKATREAENWISLNRA